MPALKVKDSDIIALHINGFNYTQIAEQLNITRQTVSKVVKKYTENNKALTNEPTSLEALKNVIKLEITQENTLSELAKQMKDYTDQYEKAMKAGDERSAYAWSQNRIKLVDMMAKITGLYSPRPIEQTPTDSSITINFELVD